MTTTPHGQVPEALIDLIDAYAETRHRCGGIYNARTEAARKAVIEALSGVQALSAVPEAFLSRVIALCTNRGSSPENIEAWDKNDKWIADLWRQAEAMLAASPTPPVEQPAITSESGAVYAELPEEHWLSTNTTIVWNEDSMRDFADRTHALRMQAAPKTAPGEPFDECFPGEPRVAVPQGLIGAACFAIRNKRDGGKVLEQLRRYSVGDLSQPLAPQQEAQEPIADEVRELIAAMVSELRGHRWCGDCYPENGWPGVNRVLADYARFKRHKASQPAPAPMSECLRLLNSFEYEGDEDSQAKAFFKAHINEDWFFHVKNSLERALAAQGEKDAG